MSQRHIVGGVLMVLLAAIHVASAGAANSPMADAAMKQNREAVRSLLRQKADVNAPQVDGTTALHWAVRLDDLDTADLLIRAGAKVGATNRDGVTPLQLAALNGNAAMIEKLVRRGRSQRPAVGVRRARR
jgi:ankyrin repeat protein